MPDNQNHSAGSARHTARSGARIVSGGHSSTGADVDPAQEFLEDMREREVHPVLQYEFIRELERDLDDN